MNDEVISKIAAQEQLSKILDEDNHRCEKWKAIDEDEPITIKNVLERWRR